MTPGEAFRAHFHDVDLVEFADCRAFYKTLNIKGLLHQYRLLISPEIMRIPFEYSGRRYYALFACMADFAAEVQGPSREERVKIVNLCIDLNRLNTARTDSAQRAKLAAAVAAQMGRLRSQGLYPIVADLIERETRNYDGAFPKSMMGQLLERADDPRGLI